MTAESRAARCGNGGTKGRFGGRGRDVSPLHGIRRGLPPTLILHGKADATVPYSDVERFCTESRALSNQCELIGYEGAGHGFFNPGRGGTWHSDTLREMDAFLTRLGYLTAGSPHATEARPRLLPRPQASVDHRATSQPSRM